MTRYEFAEKVRRALAEFLDDPERSHGYENHYDIAHYIAEEFGTTETLYDHAFVIAHGILKESS